MIISYTVTRRISQLTPPGDFVFRPAAHTARSPVYSHLSASLNGLQTIRAYRVQATFVREFNKHQDLHSEAWFLFLATSRWFAVRLDLLCACFLTAVAMCSVFAADSQFCRCFEIVLK